LIYNLINFHFRISGVNKLILRYEREFVSWVAGYISEKNRKIGIEIDLKKHYIYHWREEFD